ncbi:MAG: hypothetical protein IKY10_03650 [Clostridia bacterium]|nr:hypothetical protein [Clostridia bacterium]
MKELLIGMGLGFVVGAVMAKTNNRFAEKVEQGMEKSKEIVSDIKDEVKNQMNKSKKTEE